MTRFWKMLVISGVLLISSTAFVACSSERSAPPADLAPAQQEVSASTRGASEGANGPAARPAEGPRARVVTLTVAITVDDVLEATDRLRGLADEHGGYLASSEVAASSGGGARVVLRVPDENLAEVRERLRRLGELTTEEQRIEDVTASRADLGARLRNARAHEARLLQIVADRTASLSDLLEAERELGRVREGIERLEAQSRALEDRIAYATLNVHLTARVAPAVETSFLDDPLRAIASGARAGLRGTWAVVVGGAVIIATLAPGAALVSLIASLFYGLLWLVRWRRRSASIAR